jgi:hypothetical protein
MRPEEAAGQRIIIDNFALQIFKKKKEVSGIWDLSTVLSLEFF